VANKVFTFVLLSAVLFLQGCFYSLPVVHSDTIVGVCKPKNKNWFISCMELDQVTLVRKSGEELVWSLESKNPRNNQAAFVALDVFGEVRCYFRPPNGDDDDWFVFSCIKEQDPQRYFFETAEDMMDHLNKSIEGEA